MKEITDIKEINLAFILEYVKEQGPDAIQWLKDLKNKPVPPDKNGRERKMSFIELRHRPPQVAQAADNATMERSRP